MVRLLLLLTITTSCVSYPPIGMCLSSSGSCELCEEGQCLPKS